MIGRVSQRGSQRRPKFRCRWWRDKKSLQRTNNDHSSAVHKSHENVTKFHKAKRCVMKAFVCRLCVFLALLITPSSLLHNKWLNMLCQKACRQMTEMLAAERQHGHPSHTHTQTLTERKTRRKHASEQWQWIVIIAFRVTHTDLRLELHTQTAWISTFLVFVTTGKKKCRKSI